MPYKFSFSFPTCSHKKSVLNFLDQLISIYEHEYMLGSSINAGSSQAFHEKVSQLADANGLPSKGYASSLSEFSFNKWRSHLNKVSQFEEYPWTTFLSCLFEVHIAMHVL